MFVLNYEFIDWHILIFEVQLYNEAVTQLNLLKSQKISEDDNSINKNSKNNVEDECIRLLLSLLYRPSTGGNEASQRQTGSESSADLDRVDEAQLNQVASEFSSRFTFKATYD